MSTRNPRGWFQARLRWAIMEPGDGLVRWREAEHIFLSESRETAFQEALRIGYAEEYSLIPDERNDITLDCRFAQVVYLEEWSAERTAFEIYLGEKEATERLDFDHVFEPERELPQPIF